MAQPPARRRSRCDDCDAEFDAVAIRTIGTPHPKRPGETVLQAMCPECGICNRFTALPDAPRAEPPSTHSP